MIPVIGITGSYDRDSGRTFLSRYYIQAVEAAGGLPLVIPPILSEAHADKILSFIDGLLLSGGVDVDPLIFGEEPLPAMGDICPRRDQLELSLTRRALAMDMPIFGICRGVQVLNIAAGGGVIQDIGSAIQGAFKHDQLAPRWYGTHTVHTMPGSKLASVLGGAIVVNTFHHQAVGRVAEDFEMTAWSLDGVVEGIESKKHRFAVGVQCHPECMWDQNPRILALFQAFIEACKITG